MPLQTQYEGAIVRIVSSESSIPGDLLTVTVTLSSGPPSAPPPPSTPAQPSSFLLIPASPLLFHLIPARPTDPSKLLLLGDSSSNPRPVMEVFLLANTPLCAGSPLPPPRVLYRPWPLCRRLFSDQLLFWGWSLHAY